MPGLTFILLILLKELVILLKRTILWMLRKITMHIASDYYEF